MTPYLEWAVLIPPWAFEPWYRNLPPPSFGPLIAYTGRGVLPAFALGLVTHAVGAVWLTYLTIRTIDTN
jgi:hypothetical protein